MDKDFVKIGQLTSKMMDTWESTDDTETLKSVPLLKKLNETGFVTTNSQIGIKMKNPIHADGHIMRGYEYRQRAYLTGIVHKSKLSKLEKLSHESDLAVYMHKGSLQPNDADSDIMFKFGNRVPVTLEKRPGSPFKEATWSSPESSWTYEWSNLMPKDIAADQHLCRNLQKNGLCVEIIDMAWGRAFHALQQTLKALL